MAKNQQSKSPARGKPRVSYAHVALNTRAGKWQSIRLRNMVADMSPQEVLETGDALAPLFIAKAEERLARLKELDAPQVILDGAQKAVRAAREGSVPALQILKAQARKNA